MSNGFKFGQHAAAHVIRGVHNKTMKPLGSSFGIGGLFNVACYDKSGSLKWETEAKNGVTNAGLDGTLDVFFNATDSVGGAGSASWQFALGVIDNVGFSALDAADTHDSHAGWSEFTLYTIATDNDIRPAWTGGAASGQQVENPVFVDYDITSAGTIYGVFIVGGNVAGAAPAATDADNKGSTDTTPLLWATAQFTSGPQVVIGGDILRVRYTISVQSA